MNPLTLSIILPNYNHGHFLPMAIESALTQSFTDFELIIVDDGSSDNSLAVVQNYIKLDSRVKLIKHAQNRGVAQAVMTGALAACGTYLHGLSATDCYRSGFLEKSICLLSQYPQIGLCCTDCGLFENDPTVFVAYPLLNNASHPLVFPPEKIHRVFKYARFSTPGLTSIVKREAFLRYGGYRPDLHFLCDWFLNHQIALFEGAIYIPETLVLFRKPQYTLQASHNPRIFKAALQNLTTLLLQNRETLRRMDQAASLGLLCKKQIPSVLKHPCLWTLYINLAEKYLYKWLRKSFKKDLASRRFLKMHSL